MGRGALIVLDTDQLETAGFPDGAVFMMLRRLAGLHGHTLAVPQTVATEHVARHRREVEQAWNTVRGALLRGDAAVDTEQLEQLTARTPDEAAEHRSEALGTSFTVLAAPEGAAEDALRQAHDRPLPARPGWEPDTGGEAPAPRVRSTVIWLTLLAAFEARDQMLWFLSTDRDFAGRRGTFRTDMRVRAAERLGEEKSLYLGLYQDGIPELLRRSAPRKTLPPQELDLLLRSESVARRVRSTAATPHLAFDGRLGRPFVYEVGDKEWWSGRVRWMARREGDADAFTLTTRMLIELGTEPRAVRGATILDFGPAGHR